jgi:hypothetical protein
MRTQAVDEQVATLNKFLSMIDKSVIITNPESRFTELKQERSHPSFLDAPKLHGTRALLCYPINPTQGLGVVAAVHESDH